MKRILLAVCAILLIIGFVTQALAAGSWSSIDSRYNELTGKKTLTFTMTSDSGGNFPAALTIPLQDYDLFGYYLVCVEVKFGTTQPTTGYTTTIKSSSGNDIITDGLKNLATSSGGAAYAMPTAWIPITSDQTVTVSGTTAASATATYTLIYTQN